MKQQRKVQKETTQNEISSQKVITFRFLKKIKERSFLVHSMCMRVLRDRESLHTVILCQFHFPYPLLTYMLKEKAEVK